MKNILKYVFAVGLACSVSACHDLVVPVTTEMTPGVFPKDSLQFIQTSGSVYAALRGNYALDYWFVQTLSTDEAILPARGGNWYDGGKYKELHYHSWTADNAWINSSWYWLSLVISYSNQTLAILEKAEPDTYTLKKSNLAEIRMVRAIAYFMMMDLFGNVPIITTYGDFTLKEKSSTKDVFNFIETEVKAVLPNLSDQTGITTYGRPNKYTAYALLAKMYLNAKEVYTGDDRYNDCISNCDLVINSGKFSIEPMGTYLQMFYPNNGPLTKEFIFAIPFDPAATALSGTNGMMYRARYTIPKYTQFKTKYGLPYVPSGPESTLPEFYAYFQNDANDVRNKQWLTGVQYQADGVTPIQVTTTNIGYDYTYSGSNPGGSYTFNFTLTPNISLRLSDTGFDLGNDDIAWSMGYRNNKFYPDATSSTRNQSNDMPVFRYSDILLMKAEAILRGGAATGGATAVDLVNQVRSNRSTSAAWANVTLDALYQERAREFVSETWHRNDMIRFGKYEGSWGFKTNTETYRRVFPIPTSALKYNIKLVQNDGY